MEEKKLMFFFLKMTIVFFEDVRKKERILTTKNPIENPEILCGSYGMKKSPDVVWLPS